jgi:hypothetical protein
MAQIGKKIRIASNPHQKKRRPMAAKKKTAAKRKNSAHRNGNKKRRNPCETPSQQLALVPNRRKNPRRRNPDFLRSIVGSPKTLVIGAVSGLTAAVITRQLPQMLMKQNNTGWKGYAANVAAGLASTYAASRLAGPEAATAALIGASVILLDRILTEKVSPLGKYLALSGAGDATATGNLGTIADGYFVHPVIVDRRGQPVIPHQITDASVAAMMQQFPQLAAAQQQPQDGALQGTTGNRFRSRFATAA